MFLTHYGHACVLAELPVNGTSVRVLIDPGTYSEGFDDLTDLDLVLITHSHPDHLDETRVRSLLASSPHATVVSGPDATGLADLGGRAVAPGDRLAHRGVEVAVTGSGKHAAVHRDIPVSENNGYLVGGSLLHPGDALDAPGFPVDVLLVPVGGPWLKLEESVDYLREAAPRVAVPIHQGGLSPAHRRLHHTVLAELAPPITEVVVLDHAVRQEIR